MANPKTPAWYGGGLSAFMVPGANLTEGGLFYVDGVNGVDTNTGLTPDNAFLTIFTALAACNDDENNYIIVLEYPANGASPGGAEAYPIVIDKNRVHILGASFPHMEGDKFAFLGATADTEIFSIQAQWIEIAYLKLSGGTAHAAIEFGASTVNCKGAVIHHNQFSEKTGTIGNAAYGIFMEANNTLGGNWCYIAYNKFYPCLTSQAIRFDSNPAYPVIHGNTFLRPGNVAIYINAGGAGGEITDNRFSLISDTTGFAVTFTAAAVGDPWWIDGNSAHFGSALMAANPFRDIGVIPGPLENNWGMNFRGNVMTLPVVA